MCLEALIQIDEQAPRRIGARRLSELSGLVITSASLDGTSALHVSVSGGCSCELLAKGANAEGPTWTLEPEYRPKLETLIRALASEAGKFRVLFHWLNGDIERTVARVGTKDFLKLLAADEIGNNVLYQVSGKA